MSTTITGKLNNNANEFQAGESAGFGFGIGVQYYDRESKSKQWTNYEGALFSNNQNQIDYLRNNLVSGSVITITAKTEYVKSYDGQNGLRLSIGLNDCSLDYVVNSSHQQAPSQSQQQAPQQGGYQQQPQQNNQQGYQQQQSNTFQNGNGYRD